MTVAIDRTTPGGYASRLVGFDYPYFDAATSAEEFAAIFTKKDPPFFWADLTAALLKDRAITEKQHSRWTGCRARPHVIDFACAWKWLEKGAATVKAKGTKVRSA